MSINNIIKELAQNPEQLEQKAERRSVLRTIGSKVALAAVPFAAANLFSGTAYGQSKETIINRLNYLLKLEYIVEQLYTQALAIDKLVPADFTEHFKSVLAHNKLHIETLKNLVKELGGTEYTVAPDKVDLSGGFGNNGGPFYEALTNTKDFLVLAQFLGDSGARMYRGQITEVLSDKIVVRTLMTLHSVKARQAAFVRFVRGYMFGLDLKPWITGTNSDNENPATQRGYAGDSAVSQGGITITGINGYDVSADKATQAFDEPLTQADGLNILDRFINPF